MSLSITDQRGGERGGALLGVGTPEALAASFTAFLSASLSARKRAIVSSGVSILEAEAAEVDMTEAETESVGVVGAAVVTGMVGTVNVARRMRLAGGGRRGVGEAP